MPTKAARKITVEVPPDLLRRARQATGMGLTATVRQGLELVAAGRTYEELLRLKGRVPFTIDLAELRQDRPLKRSR